MAAPRFPLWTPPVDSSMQSNIAPQPLGVPPHPGMVSQHMYPLPHVPRPTYRMSTALSSPPQGPIYYPPHHQPNLLHGYPGPQMPHMQAPISASPQYSTPPMNQVESAPYGGPPSTQVSSPPYLPPEDQATSTQSWTYPSTQETLTQQQPHFPLQPTWLSSDDTGDQSMNDTAKTNIIEQFVTLLQERGPQEPSSEPVLNLFLALTTHERKVIMSYGSIKAFLREEGVITLDGNTMILRDLPSQEYSEISIEEDGLSDVEEDFDEQQLLFEQKASSHGIHITSPIIAPSNSQPRFQNDQYANNLEETYEEEPYDPYSGASSNWNPSDTIYSEDVVERTTQEVVSDMVMWSAEDDQALDEQLQQQDEQFNNNYPVGRDQTEVQPTKVDYHTFLDYHEGATRPETQISMSSSREQVNETIQKLQQEIVLHEKITQMASHLVGEAIAQAQNTLLEAFKSASGEGAINKQLCDDNANEIDNGRPLSSSPACSPCPSPAMALSQSSLNPSLPSFVPASNLSATAKEFTPTSTHREVPVNTSLNATARVFTPRAPTPPQSPALSDSSLRGSPLVSIPEGTTVDREASPSSSMPLIMKVIERKHRDSQTEMTTLRCSDKRVGTSHFKRRHVGLQVGFPKVHIMCRDASTSTDPVEEDELIATIDSLQYDEMVARAAAAEEALILLQSEINIKEGLHTLKQLETAFMSLPVPEQRSTVQAYVALRENIQTQISTNQEMADKNVLAIREGAWLNTLPMLSWEPPDIPPLLRYAYVQKHEEEPKPDSCGDVDVQNSVKQDTSNKEEGSDSTPAAIVPSASPTAAHRTERVRRGVRRRSSSRSLSISSDHSEHSKPTGLVDGVQDVPEKSPSPAPSSVTSSQDGSSVPQPAVPPMLPEQVAALLQPMMMSLAQVNPALTMQPQLLYNVAMQHLMSMQRAGLVPGMSTSPSPTSPSLGMATSHSPLTTVTQSVTNPVMSSLPSQTAGNNLTSNTVLMNPLMTVPASASRTMPASSGMIMPISASMTMPVSAGMAMSVSAGMAMPGSASTTMPVSASFSNAALNATFSSQRSQIQTPPLNTMTATTDTITSYNNTKPVATSSRTSSSSSRESSCPSPGSTPSDLSNENNSNNLQSQKVKQGTVTKRPPARSLSEVNAKDPQSEIALQRQSSLNEKILVSSKPEADVAAATSATKETSVNKTVSHSSAKTPLIKYGPKARAVKQKQAAMNDLPTEVPAEEDWGDSLDYDMPVFKLNTSTVPKPVKMNQELKPLPVVASSIKSVPVNRPNVGKKPLAGVVVQVSGTNEVPKPTLEEVVRAREATSSKNDSSKGAKSDYDLTNGSMAGLDEFGDDDFYQDADCDDWQEGSKRKKKGKLKTMASDEKEDSSFDKLVTQMMSKFPHLSKTEVVKIIQEVRTQRGSFKGVKAQDIMSDAQNIIKKQNAAAQETKVSGSLLYKTQICEYWKAGTCVNGEKCVYAHGKTELRPPPKHILCTNWKKNRHCERGDKCIFAHSEQEMVRAQQNMGTTKKAQKKEPTKKTPATAKATSWASVLKPPSTATANKFSTLDDNDEDEDDGPTCVICCDGISETRKKMLECGHQFHINCIRRWIEGEERTCPTCRSHALLVEDYPMLG